nr:FAM125 domain containing protein [Haemonchus contortus]
MIGARVVRITPQFAARILGRPSKLAKEFCFSAMVERELAKSEDCETTSLPITALCIVSDKNKCPKGFTPITRCHDDGSDADLWRESAFSLWSRPVRYLAISREVPEAAIRGTVSVVTDITVVKDTDPIPHGFIAIDYCADSREKSLRKRFICVKTEPRDSVVDAVGEVIILNKQKKTPRDFTLAGEIDGASLCFRVVVVPTAFGLGRCASDHGLSTKTEKSLPPPPIGLYPQLRPGSIPSRLDQQPDNPGVMKIYGDEGVPFKLNPQLASKLKAPVTDTPYDPKITFDIRRLDSDEFNYLFTLERATLVNSQ